MLALDVAARAVREQWAENFTGPQEPEFKFPAGTVEIAYDEYGAWRRIWCPDGTVRRIPDGVEALVDAVSGLA